jgi:hypothetical protein
MRLRRASFIGGSASRRKLGFLSRFPTGVFTMTISSRAALAALVSLFLVGPALAQNAAPAKTDTKTDAAAPADKKMAKPRSAESLECSKQADAKGLHGKERKKFRSECKKEAAEKPKS